MAEIRFKATRRLDGPYRVITKEGDLKYDDDPDSIDGTYHCVSPKHLQLYVNEFVFRYNLRNAPIFPALIAQACLPVAGVGENHV